MEQHICCSVDKNNIYVDKGLSSKGFVLHMGEVYMLCLTSFLYCILPECSHVPSVRPLLSSILAQWRRPCSIPECCISGIGCRNYSDEHPYAR